MQLSNDIITAAIVIAAIILISFITSYSKRLHYLLSGFFLIFFGGTMFISMNGGDVFNINDYPAASFFVYMMIVFSGKDLVFEGLRSRNRTFRYQHIIFGLFLITLTTIPTLNSMKITNLIIPTFDAFIQSIIYVLCGLFLIIGVFTLSFGEKSKEHKK